MQVRNPQVKLKFILDDSPPPTKDKPVIGSGTPVNRLIIYFMIQMYSSSVVEVLDRKKSDKVAILKKIKVEMLGLLINHMSPWPWQMQQWLIDRSVGKFYPLSSNMPNLMVQQPLPQ
jgi:hypothetical protein